LVAEAKKKLRVILPDSASREGCGEKDHRGITKVFRSYEEVNQNPGLLQSWRGPDALLYKSKPGELDIAEVAQLSTTLLLIPVRECHQRRIGQNSQFGDALNGANWLQRDAECAGSQQSSFVQIDFQTGSGHAGVLTFMFLY
jgi:hypothetical protein